MKSELIGTINLNCSFFVLQETKFIKTFKIVKDLNKSIVVLEITFSITNMSKLIFKIV